MNTENQKKVEHKKSILGIIGAFLKIGTIGFGGGSALIPVIEKEVVEDKGWIDEDKYIEHTVAANITPGALPVKLGASIGQEIKGGFGAFFGGFSTALPGVFFTIMLVSLIASLGEHFIHYIEYASVGISVFIILLLVMYIHKVMVISKNNNILKPAVIILIASFIVTAGKEVRQVISLVFNIESLPKALYDISTLNLMIISFFLIFFLSQDFSKKRLAYGLVVAYLYMDLCAKNGFLKTFKQYIWVVVVLMIVSVLYVNIKAAKGNKGQKGEFKFDFKRLNAIGIFFAVTAVVLIIAAVLFPGLLSDVYKEMEGNQNLLVFAVLVFLSTITSFGGGEAYVTVADGIFVQGGYVPANIFYGTIIAIANALPGPILVKVASAIGFYFGYTATGSLAGGFVVAAAIMLITVLTSCSGMVLVVSGYYALKDSVVLKHMRFNILLVLLGMLITTSFAMIVEALKITSSAGINSFLSLGIIAALFGGLYYLHKKFHIHDVILIVIAAIISFAINAFGGHA